MGRVVVRALVHIRNNSFLFFLLKIASSDTAGTSHPDNPCSRSLSGWNARAACRDRISEFGVNGGKSAAPSAGPLSIITGSPHPPLCSSQRCPRASLREPRGRSSRSCSGDLPARPTSCTRPSSRYGPRKSQLRERWGPLAEKCTIETSFTVQEARADSVPRCPAHALRMQPAPYLRSAATNSPRLLIPAKISLPFHHRI